MTYELNPNHPLYANIVEAIGVQGGSLVSLKSARSFTVDNGASFVSGGPYGEALRSVANSTVRTGATFSPPVSINTVSVPNATQLLVLNSISGAAGWRNPLVGHSDYGSTGIGVAGGKAIALRQINSSPAITGTRTVIGNGPHSLALTRSGVTGCELFVDGTSDGSAGGLTASWYPIKANEIGGVNGTGSNAAEFVWAFWFDKVLSQAEIAAIHASLGPNNAISLIVGGGAPALSFTGSIGAQSAIVGVPFSLATAGFFSGGAAPYSFSLAAGALPAGLVLDAASGVIGGTPTATGLANGIVVRANDSSGIAKTASSNAFGISVASAANPAPVFVGPDLPDLAGTDGTALSPANWAGAFSDSDGLSFSAIGTWPPGIALSPAGVISGTPTAPGNYAGLRIRATDTAAQSIDSNTFAINIASVGGAILTSAPLKNNTGTALTNVGGITAFVHGVASGALVTSRTGLATNGQGVLSFSDGALAAGTAYRLIVRITGTGAEGMSTVIATSSPVI